MFFGVVDGGDHIIVVPAPVFLPGEIIPDQAAVTLQGEIRMYIVVILRVKTDAFHHSAYGAGLGKLSIPYREGELVGNNFPAHLPVEGNRIGVEK